MGQGSVFADADFDISTQNFGAEKMQYAAEEDQYPFRISAHGDYIQRSKIDKKYYHHSYVNFHTAEISAEGILYYNQCHGEGIGAGVGLVNTRFDWNHNPFFKVKDVNQVTFTVAGFSARVKNWMWHAQVTANWEPKYKDFWDYTNYDIILWGKYDYLDNVNLHFGFLAQTGMKIDHIFPIFGFDWTISEKWQLNAVFPLNLSINYVINSSWTVSLATRIWNIRYRVGKDEHLKRALLYYRNQGAELSFNYGKGHFAANVHAGITLGGKFRISDQKNQNKKHFNMNSAAYVGGEAVVKF